MAHASAFAQDGAATAASDQDEAVPAASVSDSRGSVPPPDASIPRVIFARGTYKEGIEHLRIVQRADTGSRVALQIGVAIGLALLTRSTAFHGFSKDDLAGDFVAGLAPSVTDNPAVVELPRAVGAMAVRLHAKRVADGENATALPAELPLAVFPGPWHLVYENLSGDDELFRMRFGAALNWKPRPFAIHGRPLGCSYESTPIPLTQWRDNNWQLLREERAKAVAACEQAFEAGLPDWL